MYRAREVSCNEWNDVRGVIWVEVGGVVDVNGSEGLSRSLRVVIPADFLPLYYFLTILLISFSHCSWESVKMATKHSSHDRSSLASSEKAEQAPPRYEDEHINYCF